MVVVLEAQPFAHDILCSPIFILGWGWFLKRPSLCLEGGRDRERVVYVCVCLHVYMQFVFVCVCARAHAWRHTYTNTQIIFWPCPLLTGGPCRGDCQYDPWVRKGQPPLSCKKYSSYLNILYFLHFRLLDLGMEKQESYIYYTSHMLPIKDTGHGHS